MAAMSALGSCGRHVIKTYSFIVLLAALGLLVYCGLKARASGCAWTDVESLWFPAWLATMSGLLMLQALLAGAGISLEAPSMLAMVRWPVMAQAAATPMMAQPPLSLGWGGGGVPPQAQPPKTPFLPRHTSSLWAWSSPCSPRSWPGWA